MSTENELETFLRGAREQGFLTAAAAEECRKIALVLMDVDSALPIHEIAVRKGFLSRKQADTVLRATARRRVGPYEVIEKVGAGAVGRVYRARDTRTGAVVALKLLADAVRNAPGGDLALQRFLREARVAISLNHPNVVRGIESGEAAGYTYLAMEYVPGESLESRLSRGKIPEKEAFQLAREVVRGFEQLQQFQLIHRDVKPGNIMLTPDGHVKLLDLGLTRPALREAKELGVVEVPLGTAVYVSPEQITRPDNIDWRADVYSLGATLYHMVTGAPPFTGETPQTIAKRHQETPPRDPREFTIELSEGATNVILKMLQKDPSQRHASLADLATDMESVVAGKVPVHTLSAAPVPAKAASVAPRATRAAAAPRKRGPGGLIAAAVVLAGGGAAAWFLVGRGGAAPTDVAGGGGARTGTPATGTPGAGTGTPDAAPAGDPSAIPGEDDFGTDLPPDPAAEAEEAARAALKQAMDYWREHPTDYVEARARLQFVADRHSVGAVRKQVRDLIAEVTSRQNTAAERALARIAPGADAAESAGRLAEAWLAYREFPTELADTPAGRTRQASQARVTEAARKVVDDSVRAAQKAASEGRYTDAKKALSAAAIAEIPATEATLRAAREDIEAREAQALGGREIERDQFDDVWSHAVLLAGAGDADGAARAVADGRRRLEGWAKELDDLAAALPGVARVADAARKAWSAANAESVRLSTPARPGGVVQGKTAGLSGDKIVVDAGGAAGKVALELREVAAEDVARFAARGFDPHAVGDQRGLLLYLLGRRAFAAARTQIEAVRLAGGSAAEATADTTRVERRSRREIDGILRRAEAARRQKRPADVKAAVAEAEKLAPGDPSVQIALAVVALDAGSADEARQILERVLAGKDPPAEAHLRLGQALALKGDLEKAKAELRGFLDVAGAKDPHRAEAETAFAEVADKLARTAGEQARKNGNRLFQSKKWSDAETSFERVLELIPYDAEALLRLGVCYARQNKVFEAWRQFTTFVRRNPAHAKVGEAQKELQALEQHKAVRAEDREAVRDAVKALDGGRFDEAVVAFGRALVTSPFFDAARLGLGRALVARGKASGSREDLTAGIEALSGCLFLDEAVPDAWLARAEASFALGDLLHAAEDAGRAAKLDVTGTAAPLLAGDAWIRLGRLTEARESYADAHRRSPSARALYGMAVCDERNESFDRAFEQLEELQRSYELTPEMLKDVNDALRRLRPKVGR